MAHQEIDIANPKTNVCTSLPLAAMGGHLTASMCYNYVPSSRAAKICRLHKRGEKRLRRGPRQWFCRYCACSLYCLGSHMSIHSCTSGPRTQFRQQNPDLQQFTYWSNRFNCRAKNLGRCATLSCRIGLVRALRIALMMPPFQDGDWTTLWSRRASSRRATSRLSAPMPWDLTTARSVSSSRNLDLVRRGSPSAVSISMPRHFHSW